MRFTSLMPFSALPALGGVAYAYLSSQPRAAEVEIEGASFRALENSRRVLEGQVVSSSLARYLQPGLNVTAGSVICLELQTASGSTAQVALATMERDGPSGAVPETSRVDYFLSGQAFDEVRRRLSLQAPRPASTQGLTIALAPYRNAGAVLAGVLLPAILLFGTVSLALAVSRLLPGDTTEVVTSAVVGLLAVGCLLVLGFRATRPGKSIQLQSDARGLSFGRGAAISLSELRATREVYVFHSKYGSFRFPSLLLTGGETVVRVSVWQESAMWQASPRAPAVREGKAPDYLAGERDFARLVEHLEAQAVLPRARPRERF